MKISQLQPGQRVWNVERRGLGNTTLRDTAVFSIIVKEVDPEGKFVIASWNSNPPQRFRSNSVSKWRKDKPITVAVGFGASRLANREELKLIKAQKEIDAVQPEGDSCEKHRSTRYRLIKVDGGATIKCCNDCRKEQGFKPL
jgi:hypothetical protein